MITNSKVLVAQFPFQIKVMIFSRGKGSNISANKLRRRCLLSSDLLPFNDPDTPTLLHRSSPDISFAPSSLALSCSWEVLQDLGSDHLPILLSVPLSLSFAPTGILPLSIFESSLGWLCLPLSFCRAILVSFSFLCCFLYLSGTECGQIFHSLRPHQTPT